MYHFPLFWVYLYLFGVLSKKRQTYCRSSAVSLASFRGSGGRASILLFFEVLACAGDESSCNIVFDVFDTEFLIWFFSRHSEIDLLLQSTSLYSFARYLACKTSKLHHFLKKVWSSIYPHLELLMHLLTSNLTIFLGLGSSFIIHSSIEFILLMSICI